LLGHERVTFSTEGRTLPDMKRPRARQCLSLAYSGPLPAVAAARIPRRGAFRLRWYRSTPSMSARHAPSTAYGRATPSGASDTETASAWRCLASQPGETSTAPRGTRSSPWLLALGIHAALTIPQVW